ncbi:3-galactosyl-N-acetylglucosaminide 4-alpha-L-fucosyltransferase FUT3-like isoform X1 [Procambarus clarkii]|uniref:3-galactosyl-N-acetylglucosaminide 4-alpha-L-fucosyltransferase FUT3-like isoform X1 n=1 Tax=Procambarus clarkii TaxID=6728 RepID=UPI003743AB32
MRPCEGPWVRRGRPGAVLLLLLSVFSVCVMVEWCWEARTPLLASEGSMADEDLLLAGDPNLLLDLDHQLLSDLDPDQLSHVNPHLLPGVDPDLLIEDYSDVVGGFKDEFFARELDAFRAASDGSYPVPSQRFRSGTTPKAFVYIERQFVNSGWLRYHMLDVEQNLCPLPCKVTTDLSEVSTADVVLIHLRSVASREKVLVDLGPRDPSQPWVMFEPETHLQSNVLFHTNYKLLDGFFNRTMHHRRDSDILVLHGFIVGRGRDASFLPPSWRQDPVLFPNKTRRKLAVAFVSNCKDNSGRLQYIRTLKKYARVDVYGRCGGHKCGSSRYAEHAYKPATDPCMRMAGDSYLFYLAFENALCTDYVTEKLYNLLYYPLIPVVLGAANYSALMPPGSYINALHYTPKQLAYKMKYLADHPQEYMKMLEWRRHYQPSTVGGSRVLCDLCVRLHDPHFYHHNTIHDFYGWYVTQANCNATGTVRHQF